ncbi:MAG: hypothetical protein EX267_01160 [Acidimicrobiia bacterium]|nr:MAG: hypothetical protein EX267_01160 [Acidimicrobiia bacterium]
MPRRVDRALLLTTLVLLLVGSACAGDDSGAATSAPTTSAPTTTTTTTPQPTTTTTTLPPVEGPDPSYRVAAFYYPWYGDPDSYGEWWHWDNPQGPEPPSDIASDYYPVLGAYSAIDPTVVAQHFAWLREAGVGVVVSSWWGRGAQGIREDEAVPVLLDLAERYGIRVAFHIEPYSGRSADSVVEDVEYLYAKYGDHPAFFRSTARTGWSDDDRPKGLFFVWNAASPDPESEPVGAKYWQPAIDEIHGLPDGGLVIADQPKHWWVLNGHFDGLYQYATPESSPSFDWARTLPSDALYIPSVIPGFSAQQMGYDPSTYVDRDGGDTYRRQWEAALGAGIEPHMVSITSFNEWHEGTQIEPAAVGTARASGDAYADYGDIAPDGYLAMTATLVGEFLETDWPDLTTTRLRIKVDTTSDWTNLRLESGGLLAQYDPVSIGDTGWMRMHIPEIGVRLHTGQPLEDAEAGGLVEGVADFSVVSWEDPLRFVIERGGLGYTRVTVTGLDGGAETGSVSALWDGWSDELIDGESLNPFRFEVTRADLEG